MKGHRVTADERKPKDVGSIEADLALTRASAQGDDVARRKLVDRLLNRVRASAFCLAGGHPDAEDYAQLAFIEILGSAKSFRGESSLLTWAERITVRTTLRHIKQRRWRGQVVTLDSTREGIEHMTGEDSLARDRVSRRVTAILGTLKPKHRIALSLRLSFGYSVAEIAEMTGVPFNTVRERLRTGRKKLHRRFGKDPLLAEWIGYKEA
ncbi:MAG: sigma-70 family RNA polymerase sigma factor [Proteobacteria bacterium]|nr:sigma-70 family RNA polymerase sigma factor [Pseudomonadota bacterium]